MDALLERRRDEVLAFTNKYAKTLALSAGGEPAHELEPRVGG
jgi:hypothetical protein